MSLESEDRELYLSNLKPKLCDGEKEQMREAAHSSTECCAVELDVVGLCQLDGGS